jgi:hypothetical protein
MPKQQTSERFMISCEAEHTQLGGIVAQLTKMGLTNIKFELVSDVRSFARNTPPKDGITNIDFLRAWTDTHPTFKAIEAQRYFREAGRPPVYPSIRYLIDEGVLKKLGPGDYSRTDVKHIAPPKTKTKVATKAKKHQPSFDLSAEETLLRIGRRNHGRFTSELAKKHFAVLGRAPTGVGPCINKLMKAGLIKRGATGSYSLTAKAMAGPKGKTKTKANGAMPPPVADEVVVATPEA